MHDADNTSTGLSTHMYIESCSESCVPAVHFTRESDDEGSRAYWEYWEFFLAWYHGRLKQHGEDVLDTVLPIIRKFNSHYVSRLPCHDVPASQG
jgi:hypothetical protein